MAVDPSTRTSSIPKVDYCFDLKLGESNVETYPEFSWKELVKEAQDEKHRLSADGNITLDPYASDDEGALRALAAKFEKKYNNDGGAEKKRRKRKAEDYIDRGAGYDETDSFIDNSEVYDELVPEDIQPVHGGFYINSGRLDFKEADVSDCDVDEEIEEVRRTTGRKFSKQIVKKSLAQANKASAKKKRAANSETHTKPPKTNGTTTKTPESPKGSASNSPVRPNKIRTTTISSHSDSSTSDSSGQSSSSTSDSEKDGEIPTSNKIVSVPATTNSIPTPKPIPVAVPRLNPPPAQRRLKVKNVPLNPKLHVESPLPLASTAAMPKSATPPSNRDIFGSLLPTGAGGSIPSGLSATSILPAAVRSTSLTVPVATPSPPKVTSLPSPKNFINPNPMPKSSKMKRRVTDRVSTSNSLLREVSLPSVSPTTTPAKKRQRLDPLPTTKPVQGTVGKKPRKARVSTVNRTAPSPAPLVQQRALTPEEHHQILLQHLQRHPQLSSIGLGLSHLLPMLAPAVSTLSPSTSTAKVPKAPRRPKQSKTAATEVQKNLVTFQSQVGSGVTVSEVKKTKPHSVSPSGTTMATISPKSITPPSRLSTPSPINIPRIPIPSSITVTASTPRSQAQQHQRSSASSTTLTPAANSPNFQPVQNNKTFTDFHIGRLL